jgi:hypothetical protein
MTMRDERGQVLVLVVGLVLVAYAVVGVAVDGTRAFLFRRTLQNVADSAVLAAASEIDRARVYGMGGRIRLDEASAEEIARDWLRDRRLGAEVSVSADAGAVRMVLRGSVRTSFLRLVGLSRLGVAAEAIAQPLP